MAKKDTFDKMHKLYNAIKDIDRIIESPDEKDRNGDCKLDRILLYVKVESSKMIVCYILEFDSGMRC